MTTSLPSISTPANATAAESAREMSRKFVASAFLTPLLEAMRQEPLNVDLFHAGFGEDAFRQQLDTLVADAVVRRMDDVEGGRPMALVESIYQKVMRQTRTESKVDIHG